MILDQTRRWSWLALGALCQALQVLVAEEPVLERDPRCVQQVLAGVGAGQTEDTLEQPEGAHAALLVGLLRPAAQIEADALAAGEEPIAEGALGGEQLARSLAGAGSELTGTDASMHGDLELALEHPHEMAVPAHAHVLSEQ